MDKNEYRAKLDEINDLVDRQDYKGALEIVDTIDWRRVRSARTLCMVGEIYEANKRYDDSRKLLLLAHQRAPIGKTVLYRLVELSIKMGEFDEAAGYYKQFVEISPNDNSRYILKYKLCRAKRSSIEEQIAILQEYKSREYTERWAYELARLYAKAGMKDACIEECDDLILWFSEGKYVTKAMELKMKYAPLTASQQEKYNKRFVNRPSVSAAAASAVTAATMAAAKVVSGGAVSSQTYQDPEIEDILKSVSSGNAKEASAVSVPDLSGADYAAGLGKTENLKNRAAQDLRGVFQGKTEEAEAAASREIPEGESFSPDRKDYIVKELEPEDLSKGTGFKPFHVGQAMTMEVKAEAPKSDMFKAEEGSESAFKADIKAREIDLEALLAETASELAQAVAEETGSEGSQEEDTKEQQTENVPSESKAEEPDSEEKESVSRSGLVAPAAARAAIVAENLSSALAAKAEEIDGLAEKASEASGATINIGEELAKAKLEEEQKPEEEALSGATINIGEELAKAKLEEAEQKPSEEELSGATINIGEELAKAKLEEEQKPEEEALSGATINIGEELAKAKLEEAETAKEEQIEGTTKVIPVDEVKEAAKEMDFSAALEEALNNSVLPEKEETHMKRVTASVASFSGHTPFSNAVEGLMRHHLTEEEHRRLFTYFAPVPGMSQQISEALDIAQESACAKTSQAGNIVVTGREGSGKTRLSEGLVKALCKERQMEGAKVAYIAAEELNKKDPVAVVGKMAGGFLVVEHAGALAPEIIENMSKAMEFKTNRLTVIIEDLKPGIRELEEKYPEFMKKFDSRIVIPVFTNDELVSFAKTYAKELGYKIDDMAVLALYTLIGDNQNEENPVAIGMVREMMDEAIKKASRKGRRAGKKVSKRHLDESGRIMLYEKDFDI